MTLDYGRRAISRDGVITENFTPKEFDILSLLIQHSPNVLDRKFLVARVWGDQAQHLASRVIDVHIRRIRQKMGEQLANRLITVAGKGHKFV
jgi:DNA-binding response OmpR family regulator